MTIATLEISDEDLALQRVNHDVRYQESERYRLIRRVLVAQMNGDFDAGTKFESIIGRPDGKSTEEDFDSRMDRALILMPNPD